MVLRTPLRIGISLTARYWPLPFEGTVNSTSLIQSPVMVSMFAALEKLVEIEPLPVPFWGIVNR
jgi:hypothetical protein